MNENFKIQGKINYQLIDEFGTIKDSKEIPNLITAYFKTFMAGKSNGVGSNIGFMGIGSGTGQTLTSVDLAKYLDMIALSGTGPLVTGSQAVYSAYWAAGAGTGSITEAGVFLLSGTTRNTLCTYNDAISIQKGASDTLKIDWTVIYG